MGQIAVTIDGKSYRMACDDGQEDHLTGLAAMFDSRIRDMRASFGEIGDMRLAVMAAITLADEVTEVKRRLTELQGELAGVQQRVAAFDQTTAAREAEIAAAVAQTAERIERIARTMSGNG